MIVCLRTVEVPADVRDPYLAWIDDGRAVREAHGILAELVCEPPSGDGETVVITVWPDHAIFDAWIATPERDALTASDVHHAVDYRPITRHDVAAGYLNIAGLHHADRSHTRRIHEVGHPRPSQDRPHRLPVADPTVHRPRRRHPLRPER